MSRRIQYFSNYDGSCGNNLSQAEPILRGYIKEDLHDVNDAIEQYQIKLFIDNGQFLNRWTEQDKVAFIATAKSMWESVCNFWSKICDDNILMLIGDIDHQYQRTFWKLTDQLQAYTRISEVRFAEALNSPSHNIVAVLERENLVQHFSTQVREFLSNYKGTAELLLSAMVQKKEEQCAQIFFPKSFSLSERESIIIKYIDRPDVNLNYINLILHSKNSKSLSISAETKLRAKRAKQLKAREVFKSPSGIRFGATVSFSENQTNPAEMLDSDNFQHMSYSANYIKLHNNSLSLFHNFVFLFNYIDSNGIISLISKQKQEPRLLEFFGLRAKDEYPDGPIFKYRNQVALLQFSAYETFLRDMGRRVEDIIADVICALFGLDMIIFRVPTAESTHLEKIRMIAGEFDSLLKQYTLYVEKGSVDRELLQIISGTCHFGSIPSLVNNKYVYGTGHFFSELGHHFFSDQSMLFYVEPFEGKYNSLCELLIKENVRLDGFQSYQRPTIDYYINKGYLSLVQDDIVKINKLFEILLIGDLYHNESISYWHLSPFERSAIIELKREGIVNFGNTLFSKQEQDFFNYYLNSVFANGIELRNKYVHGTHPEEKEKHIEAYKTVLMLLVLVLLKIQDDVLLKSISKTDPETVNF